MQHLASGLTHQLVTASLATLENTFSMSVGWKTA